MSFNTLYNIRRISCLFFLVPTLFELLHGQSSNIKSTSEEPVYTYTSPNNGYGPLWGYGSSLIARHQDTLFICATETGENVPPLCNTRWRILSRAGATWQTWAEASHYRQREPCLLALCGEDLILSVNDSLTEPGTHYKACQPHMKRLPVSKKVSQLQSLMPTWDPGSQFTDHSYRGLATDSQSNRILLFNIDAVSSEQNWAYMHPDGNTLHQGKIAFPIRSCYPQVQLKGAFAAVMAISDIREPNETWGKYKKEQTGRAWDYVFRILYWTRNHDIEKESFEQPIEIANVDATAGHISNQDLLVDDALNSWLLYGKREVQSELMRNAFFPDKSTGNELWLTKVTSNGTLLWSKRIQAEAWNGGIPGWSRFHQTPDGKLWILSYVGGHQAANWITEIDEAGTVLSTEKVSFKEPFGSFLTTSHRNGHAPSFTLDLVGQQSKPVTLSHGRIEWNQDEP